MSVQDSGGRLIHFPQPFGKYTLVSHLATGGMAYVFLARQQGPAGFEKTCVIKRILPHLGENQEFVRMFLDEARIAAKLTHSHIVQIFDLGEIEGSYFLAMEYVAGKTLAQILRHAQDLGASGLPWNVATRMMADVAGGLDYAHHAVDEAGRPLHIVHRDVCPANIMVTWTGSAKILDFGIASATVKDAHTMVGTTKGRIHYMSPEQLQGHVLDGRSDLFSLGVVFYEMLYGVRPFPAESVGTATIQILQQTPTPPPDLAKQIPARLRLILGRALAKDPTERWQSTRVFQQALEQFLLDQQATCTPFQVESYLRDLFPEESTSTPSAEQAKNSQEIALDLSILESDGGTSKEHITLPSFSGTAPQESNHALPLLPATRVPNRFKPRPTARKSGWLRWVIFVSVGAAGVACLALATHPRTRNFLQKQLFQTNKPFVTLPLYPQAPAEIHVPTVETSRKPEATQPRSAAITPMQGQTPKMQQSSARAPEAAARRKRLRPAGNGGEDAKNLEGQPGLPVSPPPTTVTLPTPAPTAVEPPQQQSVPAPSVTQPIATELQPHSSPLTSAGTGAPSEEPPPAATTHSVPEAP